LADGSNMAGHLLNISANEIEELVCDSDSEEQLTQMSLILNLHVTNQKTVMIMFCSSNVAQ
jgi:hypothetical protein